jgi:nicotinamide-nucleotide amidase
MSKRNTTAIMAPVDAADVPVVLAALDATVLELADLLRARAWRMATAESCTGGLIAAACTAIAGSSDWFERGFVTYSNAAKTEMLGVPAALIAAHGAVSEPVARAMVQGTLERAPVQLAVAVTGIAGPGGAVPGKPVGTVWLAWGHADGTAPARIEACCLQLPGDRQAVRHATVTAALQQLLLLARC